MNKTCPHCHKTVAVSEYLTYWECPCCGKFFDFKELIPFFYSGSDCLENPKSHRHPDWIEQWEELDLKDKIVMK